MIQTNAYEALRLCALGGQQNKQLELAESLKTEGIERVESHNVDFVELMRSEARRLCRKNGTVTVDDLRCFAHCNSLAPKHANCWGAIFHEPGWMAVGYTRSTVVTNHARTIRVWQWGHE